MITRLLLMGGFAVLFAGCATAPAQMRSLRGTGIHKTIAASPDEIMDSFTAMTMKGASEGWYTVHDEDAVYAANTQVGLTEAIFVSSGTSAGGTDVEALAKYWLLGRETLLETERQMLALIADDVKKKRLARQSEESVAAVKPDEGAGDSDTQTEDAAAETPEFHSDVETPPFRLPEDETKFALVVGVESYQDAPKAEFAARDAQSVKAYLRAAGYPERNIIFLTDQQAGKSALEKYLEAWLPRNTDARSTVLFYFSGHGSPDAAKGDAYLMPWDADPKYVETTGYSVRRLYAKLNALKARRVLVAMDACFSGAGGRSVIAKGARPLVTKVDDGGSSIGRIGALTASASDEITGTDDASGHGLFTYQLLKSIGARGGKATLKELYDSLSPKVRDAARRDNRDQTPQLIGDGRAAF